MNCKTHRLLLAGCCLFLLLSIMGGCGRRDYPESHWEIKSATPLLNPDGTLNAWGWARHANMIYDRQRIPQGNVERLKEWDYYAILSPDFYIEMTLADINWAIMAAINFIDLQSGEVYNNLYLNMDAHPRFLPFDPYAPFVFQRNDLSLSVAHQAKERTIQFNFPQSLAGPHIRGTLTIQDDPKEEHLATAAPFHRPDYFFYTSKVVALPATGEVSVGEKSYSFPAGTSFAVLDWGRGVWPEKFEWGWAIAGGMVGTRRFGFNIGFGEEDASRFACNAMVVDGVLHKLGPISWRYDKSDIMKPWYFKSNDGRFEATLVPFHDQSVQIDLGLYDTDTTKVQGRISGQVILDDGSTLVFTDILGFAEHCLQRW